MRISEQDCQRMIQRKTFKPFICRDCDTLSEATGPRQFYCHPCSEKRDLQRKNLWAKEHPVDKQKSGKRARENLDRAKLAGLDISREHAQSINWDNADPDLLWYVRISLPFSYTLSKNHIWSTNRRGHVYLRGEHRESRNTIITTFVKALADKPIVQNKIWLDMLVQKPNHKGDAINLIDGVADALKEAIGIDDRWFSIRKLDWEIVKDDPRIYIGIGQASDENCQACSTCGRILPFTAFTKSKHSKNGIARTCPECRKVERKGRRLLTQDDDDKLNPRVEVTVTNV